MKPPVFRSTKVLFIALLILAICAYIPWEPPSDELQNPEQSLVVAGWLAVNALRNLAGAVILVVLVYRTWSNVSQLPTGGGEPAWVPTPLAAALPLLVPLFGYAWFFVAYLGRAHHRRTVTPSLPARESENTAQRHHSGI